MKTKIITFLMIALLVMVVSIDIFAIDRLDGVVIGQGASAQSSQEIINRALGIFQVAGTVGAVIAIIIIGIRYMVSSVQDKAEMKGVVGYYIVGAIMVLATVNVVKFMHDVITGI